MRKSQSIGLTTVEVGRIGQKVTAQTATVSQFLKPVAVVDADEPAAVPRGDLLEDVWGYSYEGGSNVVDAVVRSLRKKLGPHATLIETVTKVEYRYRRS